jgi:NAD-dependent SIR2 family protein deacetylase
MMSVPSHAQAWMIVIAPHGIGPVGCVHVPFEHASRWKPHAAAALNAQRRPESQSASLEQAPPAPPAPLPPDVPPADVLDPPVAAPPAADIPADAPPALAPPTADAPPVEAPPTADAPPAPPTAGEPPLPPSEDVPPTDEAPAKPPVDVVPPAAPPTDAPAIAPAPEAPAPPCEDVPPPDCAPAVPPALEDVPPAPAAELPPADGPADVWAVPLLAEEPQPARHRVVKSREAIEARMVAAVCNVEATREAENARERRVRAPPCAAEADDAIRGRVMRPSYAGRRDHVGPAIVPSMIDDSIRRAARILDEADALVIAAGAGMGVDSGLPDFRGNEGFWRAYPPLAKLGVRFEEMANPRWFSSDPALAWGFYGHRRALYARTTPHGGFLILRRWAQAMRGGCFVFTSNVDGHFQRAGFDEQIVCECHGSIRFDQCTRCEAGIWPASDAELSIDEATLRVTGALPTCVACGATARPNILMFGDGDWDASRADAQTARLRAFLRNVSSGDFGRLAVVECGAGTAVASVRHFTESLASAGARLIRINVREPEVPSGNHVGIAASARDALTKIDGERELRS